MKLELYAVKDNKVGFSQPFVCPNQAFALRMFITSVRSDKPNAANTFPEDKELWKVGELDDQTGRLTSDLAQIAHASTYVLPKEQSQEVENDGNNANG